MPPESEAHQEMAMLFTKRLAPPRCLALLIVVLSAAVASGIPAAAEVSQVSVDKCLAGKLKGIGASAAARLGCHAKAAKKGDLPGLCLQQATERFTGGAEPSRGVFQKLEARAKVECPTTDDSLSFESELVGFASDLDELFGAGAASRCEAAKFKCAAKYVAGTLRCYAKAARKTGAVDQLKCLASKRAAFSRATKGCYEKAIAKGDCSSPSAPPAAQGIVDAFVADSVCALDPAAPISAGGATDPLETFLGPCALQLTGVSIDRFNPVSAPLRFKLGGATFLQDPESVALIVNGSPIPPDGLTLEPHAITAASGLSDGKNEIEFSAVDEFGRPVFLKRTLWAGSSFVTVDLVGEDGESFGDPATVRISLVDDQSVFAETSTTSGTVEFENVPFRTIVARAAASGNRIGLTGFVGTQSSVEVRMLGFKGPSSIANNDFSLGTDGWEIGSAPAQIGPHVEGTPAPPPAFAGKSAGPRGAANEDLTLGTSGEGEQSVSRTFETEEGTSSVRVRYRFVTSEVPGGYFGSEFNDTYRVSIRSEQGGTSAGESNSMNGLGLEAFDFGSGATAWREVTLQIDPGGDTIQVDLGVSNVGDDRLDSQVVVDFVDENDDQVRPRLAWNNTDGGLDLFYRVESAELAAEATIEVYFANGSGYDNRLGSPILTLSVPEGTAAGEYGPTHIAGNLLGDDPDGTTHLIAASSDTNVGALADVRIVYGANANQAVVWEGMKDVIRDGLRAAGQAVGTVTSTARTPADQARAMFNNLVNSEHTLAENIAIQKGIYAAPGDSVIDTFASETAGLTRDQILADRANVQAAMQARIEALGPSNVSRHCGDQSQRNVLDMLATVFSASNGPRFVGDVEPRLSRFIDERATNNCYHLELE